tara:strand:+ start:9899 stop:10483 length:585 start_codon:yes stop_codon:yes gene_type:complete
MNIKKFLVCKISERFPSEVNQIIWDNVKNTAASHIARMYYYKVAKNNDIFLELMRMADYDLEITEDGETQLYQLPIDWASEIPDDFYENNPSQYPQEWSVDLKTTEKQRIAKFVKYAKKNITYKYIQDPGVWLDAIRTIREIFFIIDFPPSTWNPPINDSFWHDLKYILDKVKFENSQYQQWMIHGTGVAWWEY